MFTKDTVFNFAGWNCTCAKNVYLAQFDGLSITRNISGKGGRPDNYIQNNRIQK